MKYKEFKNWCNDRACDGCWSMDTALYCIEITNHIKSHPFWKREKVWKNNYENTVVKEIVNPTNKKLKNVRWE